jgi:hypothetical protein
MIVYDKVLWGHPLLFRLYGSALPRVMPVAILAALYCGLLSYYLSDHLAQLWTNPYAYNAFAFGVGFILVFRCVDAPASKSSMVEAWRRYQCKTLPGVAVVKCRQHRPQALH